MVSVGDRVRAGDALFEIGPDPTPQELTDVDRSVDSANASYSRAKADYERAIELARSGVLPKSDLDSKRESFERIGRLSKRIVVTWRSNGKKASIVTL